MIGKVAIGRTSSRRKGDDTSASSRKVKKEVRREEIARTAFEMFIEQGYERTTMRQIAYRAKILNGSLYNLFASKDEIFEYIMMRAIDVRQTSCNELIEGERDYMYALALPFIIELNASRMSPKIAELFHNAYGNWGTFNKIVDLDMQWMTQVSERFGLTLDQTHLRQNTIAIDGCLSKFVDSYFFTNDDDIQDNVRTLMIIMFTLLNLPLHGIDNLIHRYGELLSHSHTWEKLELWPKTSKTH